MAHTSGVLDARPSLSSSLSLPHSSFTSQINHLYLNPQFKVCFWAKPDQGKIDLVQNPDYTTYKVRQAHLPICEWKRFIPTLCVEINTHEAPRTMARSIYLTSRSLPLWFGSPRRRFQTSKELYRLICYVTTLPSSSVQWPKVLLFSSKS